MANPKIDSIQLKGGDETIYDITLPSSATPSITSLTTNSLIVNSGATFNGSNPIVIMSGTTSYNLRSIVANLGTQVTYTVSSNTLYITTK